MPGESLTPLLKPGQPPDWVRHAIFYQVFPDRFARSSRVPKPSNLESWDSAPTPRGFKGGDLLGIVDQLDHLQDLGITAIYLNPVFRSTANHRYHTHDYYEVDPILGGNEALKALLHWAHRRDIKTILDGVFNHVGRGFYQFSHLLENGRQSPYSDWFRVHSWPLHPYGPADQPPGYECWWNDRELPKLDATNQAVRDFIFRVAEHWIGQGIDGWRLDVPNEIDDDEFWREFRSRVKRLNPEAYIVGEIWNDASRWLQGDQFDAVQNYLFTRACLGFFAAGSSGYDQAAIQGTGLERVDALDAQGFRQAVDSLLALYSWPVTSAQLNHLNTHDTARFITIAGGDETSFRLATLFQMTYPGAPCIYYGDEIGLHGGRDPDCRGAFPWEAERWDDGRLAFMKRCVALRKSHPIFRDGSYASLYAQDHVYVFARILDQEIAIVALNSAHAARTVNVQHIPGGPWAEPLSLWGEAVAPAMEEGIRDWNVAARSGAVLLARTCR